MRDGGEASQIVMPELRPVIDLALVEKVGQALEIAPVGRDRVRRQAALQSQVVEKFQ